MEASLGIEALTINAAGDPVVPETGDDWAEWIAPTATRNHALRDPLLDWLNLYGEANGFQRDDQFASYDPRTDFRHFITRKGIEFEAAVVAHLMTLASIHVIPRELGTRSLEPAQATFEAMLRGEEVIYQAVVRDAESRIYGAVDFLVRSDVLYKLFPSAITALAASEPAPDLGGSRWHYRVVDAKFTTLHFLAGGELGDSNGSSWAYKVQMFLYNRALGGLQGYMPPESFLLGRGWEQRSERGMSCMDRLGAVPDPHVSGNRGSLAIAAEEACAWLRRVRTQGQAWNVLPEPSVPELRPNMAGQGGSWSEAKGRIARELDELTLLWQVGFDKRNAANQQGVLRWSDTACTSDVVGVTGKKQGPILAALLDVNRSIDGPAVRPAKIVTAQEEWRPVPPLEFYVDFEYVSDLDDNFSRIPERGGQPLIFMLGCGHLENGEWQWACFIADALSEPSEADVIDAWFAHMEAVRQRLIPDGERPKVIHWSRAEQSVLETQFNSAMKRHSDRDWPAPNWFDFLGKVVREEPVVVRGALGFGLKAVARAMHSRGHIDTDWGAGPADGMGAMVGAWSCEVEAKGRGCTLSETELMQDIARYNEVDCKVMMEIVRYLRENQ
ncbi:MAG: hypothetical protein C1O27_002340 [Chloroflexi bacterium]|nr:MAG: hypothetical protein C1O27_002340 [Chloroflexota bacterium]